MHTIEFETQVHNGILQIPEQYFAWRNKTVKVVLLDVEKNYPIWTPLQATNAANTLLQVLKENNEQ